MRDDGVQVPPQAAPAPGAASGRIAIASPGQDGHADPEGSTGGAGRHARRLPPLEILIAAVVMAVLSQAGLHAYGRAVRRARATAAARELEVIRDGLLEYAADCGTFPEWNGQPETPA